MACLAASVGPSVTVAPAAALRLLQGARIGPGHSWDRLAEDAKGWDRPVFQTGRGFPRLGPGPRIPTTGAAVVHRSTGGARGTLRLCPPRLDSRRLTAGAGSGKPSARARPAPWRHRVQGDRLSFDGLERGNHAAQTVRLLSAEEDPDEADERVGPLVIRGMAALLCPRQQQLCSAVICGSSSTSCTAQQVLAHMH